MTEPIGIQFVGGGELDRRLPALTPALDALGPHFPRHSSFHAATS
jgi:hypothetical protein